MRLRQLVLLTATVMVAFLLPGFGQGSNFGIANQYIGVTVGHLPAAASSLNVMRRVTDPQSSTDCTLGGGAYTTTIVICVSDGISWKVQGGGGGGTPGGSNTQLQYNNSSAFGGTSNGTYTSASGLFTFNQLANSNGTIYGKRFTDSTPTGNFFQFQNAAADTDLFKVDASGNETINGSLTQNGSGTGGVKLTEGTAIAGTAGLDVLFADSTAHRFKMSNNNGTADTVAGAATTDTFTNKTFNTAGSGNVFQINGNGVSAVSGTGSTVALTAGPTFTGTTTAADLTVTGTCTGCAGASSGILLSWQAAQSPVTSTGTGNDLSLFSNVTIASIANGACVQIDLIFNVSTATATAHNFKISYGGSTVTFSDSSSSTSMQTTAFYICNNAASHTAQTVWQQYWFVGTSVKTPLSPTTSWTVDTSGSQTFNVTVNAVAGEVITPRGMVVKKVTP